VVVRVLRNPPLVGQAHAGLLAVRLPAIALFARILRRGHKALTAVMALPFSMTAHARSMTQIPSTQTKKTQEEEIFLEAPFEEYPEEKPLSNRQDYTTFKSPLTRQLIPDGQSVVQTFSDINEESYSVELPYDFIKVVFCWLLNQWQLDRASAEKCYGFITKPDFIEELSPFLRLVALRAYSLILFHRKPQNFESFEDLIVALQKYQSQLSIRQLLKIFMLLPHKWVWLVLSMICAFVLWAVSNLQYVFEFWTKLFD
jgi:hypothetical protein